MAHMSQEKKKILTPGIKAVLKKFKMKGTLSIGHHMKLVCRISQGQLDVIGNYRETIEDERSAEGYHSVNTYWIDTNYTGETRQFIEQLKDAMNGSGELQNHDRSDIQSDYFNVGWYIDIHLGTYDKPYKLLDSAVLSV